MLTFNQMVEYSLRLDQVFGSLADSTRRDILRRVARSELTVSQISADYDMSLAAVSKHLRILERAKLVMKRRRGKEQLVRLSPQAIVEAREYLGWYRQFMGEKFEELDIYLNKEA
jgi:DNA-binding transcriptional ArsR family regulator